MPLPGRPQKNKRNNYRKPKKQKRRFASPIKATFLTNGQTNELSAVSIQ